MIVVVGSGAGGVHFALSLLKKIPAIRDVLSTDIEAAHEGDPAGVSGALATSSEPKTKKFSRRGYKTVKNVSL